MTKRKTGLRAAATTWQAFSGQNASPFFMHHYLNNRGHEVSVNVQDAVDASRDLGDYFTSLAAMAVADKRALTEGTVPTGCPISFVPDWVGYTLEESDWHKALGNVRIGVIGEFVVSEDRQSYTMRYERKLIDRYNWDWNQKSDRYIGMLHVVGYAQEFDVSSRDVKQVKGCATGTLCEGKVPHSNGPTFKGL